MSASSLAMPQPTPAQLARGIASAGPGQLSQSPLLGILGVIIGAGVVSLTSRMISLGVADFRGHRGFGYDEGAWIGTAFDVGLMFIGPFTVYLGGLMGPRRILLGAAGLFTLLSSFLPFIHSYALVIVALVLAGLSSGTFYPLTLTFALRSIPIRYLPFTIALYASFVDGAVNLAPSLYGWYRDHLSWQWMFWNAAVITPVMMLCIYFGIPKSPPAREHHDPPSFAGFLYASAGFALILAACEQGERLDWWHSGVFTALVASGAFLLLSSLVRRLLGPNPLVDMPYLAQRNTILLGIILFFFRFFLLTTITLVPQSLSIHGFQADQIGPAVIWSAVSFVPLAIVAGFLLLSNVDARLLLAAGFASLAFASILDAQMTSAWAAANFYRTEFLLAFGQCFAFIGLVSAIILQTVFTGGLLKPQRALTFSAYFHTVRLFGGTLGAVALGRFIAEREKLHSNLLGLHVQQGSWITDGSIKQLTAGALAKSSGLAEAAGRAVDAVGARLRLQAYTLSLNDGFYLIVCMCVIALLFVACLRESPLQYGEISAMRHRATTAEAEK
ncbi:MAG TPA: MFS transporter [Candidatus Sulfotelmatobacter sp.]|nr:MFS transporter [Candidatus Sulfotelmatobacter sp.]